MNIEKTYQDFLIEFNNHLKLINRKALLLAVSKTKPMEQILKLLALGQSDFGENYAQELRDKAGHEPPPSSNINWHYIGNVQQNKLKYIVGKTCLIHTIDSYKKAETVNDFCLKKDRVQPVLLKVNISQDPNKSGASIGEIYDLFIKATELKNIDVKGLMTITQYSKNPEHSRKYYQKMKEFSKKLEENIEKSLELSMGMSNDYKVALEEGSTIVRVGTKIFGERV